MLPVVILEIQNDDDRNFMAALYEGHYKLMRDTTSSFMLRDEADDIINETCIKLINKIPLLRSFSCCVLRSYIVSTVRSVSIDYLRKRKAESKHMYLGSEDDALNDIDGTLHEDSITPEKIAIDKESITALRKAVKRLPDTYKDLLEFKYVLELSDHEIAGIFDITPNSVRMYLTRARRKALNILKEEGVTNAGRLL